MNESMGRSLSEVRRRLFARDHSSSVATVAFNQRPMTGSWGGSNQFVVQMAAVLKRRGYTVRFDLKHDVDLIILVDPRQGTVKPFDAMDIADFKTEHPDVKVLHRINECDERKGTDFIDEQLKQANALADHTIFISRWLRNYHSARWFDDRKTHSIIYNGADPSIFFPARRKPRDLDKIRIVTHHWSPHWLKGFDVYQGARRPYRARRVAWR